MSEQLGRYEILEEIGQGGFAIVHRARDTELDRNVALKIPRKDQLNSTEAEKFLREARTAAQLEQLKHSGIDIFAMPSSPTAGTLPGQF